MKPYLRWLGSPFVLIAAFLVVYGGVQWMGRSFDWMAHYPDGRGFPVLKDTFPGLPTDVPRPLLLRRLPLTEGDMAAGLGAFDLPALNPDPALTRNEHIDYRREVISPQRIEISLKRYGDGAHADWSTARYALTPQGIEPLAIRGGGGWVVWLIALGAGAGCVALLRWLAWRCADPNADAASSVTTPWLRGDGPWITLLLAPFSYYAWVLGRLVPCNWPDSVVYLWRRPLSGMFLDSRSLTQRVLFRIVGDANVQWIVFFQLACLAACCVGLFLLLRRRSLASRACVAAALGVLFSSYLLSAASIIIAAEPLMLALQLLFPIVLLCGQGRHWMGLTLLLGLMFIFSKNIAPFLTLVLIASAVVLDWVRPGLRAAGSRVVYACLAVAALCSIVHTQRADPSLSINTMASLQRRILNDTEATRYFIEHYGLPDGDYLDQLRGQSVLAKLDGQGLFMIDAQTLDFRLLPDAHGYTAWITQHGRKALADYLIRVRPGETLREYIAAYAAASRGNSLGFLAENLGPIESPVPPGEAAPPSPPPNREVLAAHAPNGAAGFLGFDPWHALQPLIVGLGFGNFWSIVLIACLGLWGLRRAEEARWLRPALGMLAMGLACFFLSHFGDEPNDPRHDFPAFVFIYGGGLLLVGSAFDLGLRALRGHRKRSEA